MAIFGSSGYRRRANSDPFTDLLFNALLGFTFLFLIAIMFMNPVAKKGIIDPKAEYIITITWADNNPDDVDTWVEDPNGNLIWFRNREAGLVHLDRDGETILEKKGDEKTAVRFVIDKSGTVRSISHINKSLVVFG